MVRFRHRLPTSDKDSIDSGWVLPTLGGLLLIGVGLVGIGVVWSLIDVLASSTLSGLPIGLSTTQLAGTMADGSTVTEAKALVTVTAGLGYRTVWWLTGPASGVLALFGLVSLRRVVATAQAGDPFIVGNVSRIRTVALLTIAYFLLTIAHSFVAIAIQTDLDLETVTATLSFTPIVLAVILFALAEVWRRGVELREEQQLTV